MTATRLWRVTYYNRRDQLKHRQIGAVDAAQAKALFRAVYENRYGFAPTVVEVIPWN